MRLRAISALLNTIFQALTYAILSQYQDLSLEIYWQKIVFLGQKQRFWGKNCTITGYIAYYTELIVQICTQRVMAKTFILKVSNQRNFVIFSFFSS